MPTLTASEARARLFALLDQAGEPIQISGRRNNAVLISERDWRAIQETLYLLSIPGMRAVNPERDEDAGSEVLGRSGLVGSWGLVYTAQVRRDARKLARAGLRPRAERLLAMLRRNPFEIPPPFERLVGDLAGVCSRRINIQHRIVYQVLDQERVVKVLRLWTHHE